MDRDKGPRAIFLTGGLGCWWLFIVAPPLTAQGLAECLTCSMTARELVVLGRDEDDGVIGDPGWTIQLAGGDWIVYDYMNRGTPLRYARDGSPRGEVARRGAGPREFGDIMWLHRGPGDSIYVVDWGNGRLAVRDSQFRSVRTWSPGLRLGQVIVLRGGVVTTDAQSLGAPTAFLSWDHARQPIGRAPGSGEEDNSWEWWRSITPASDTSFWAAEILRYRIEEWSHNGRLLRSITHREEWFPPQDRYGVRAHEEPRPGLVAVDQDAVGVLWILIKVADRGWRSAAQAGTDPYGRPAEVVDLNLYYDTVIHAIHVETQTLLGSYRADENMTGFAGDHLVYAKTQTPLGSPTVTIWELELSQRR